MSTLEIGLRAFTTFFATIGPVDVAALFAVLAGHATPVQRRWMAIKGTLIAFAVMLVFVVVGETLLRWLGITLAAMRTAGGILLLLVAIDMVLARPSGCRRRLRRKRRRRRARPTFRYSRWRRR